MKGRNKMENRKLKRVVIKEELVELTGDFKSAIVLNQLIYWSERIKDTDDFLIEEKERIEKYGNYEFDSEKAEILKDTLTHGWIYKKAAELAEDCLVGLSSTTMGRILKSLVSHGWIDERSNPIYKWDRTKQYRVNIAKIQHDLNKIGYALEGYSLDKNSAIFQNENCNSQNEKCVSQNEFLQNQNEFLQNQNGKSQKQNERAIPEITTEITNTEITNTEITTTQYTEEIRGGSSSDTELNNLDCVNMIEDNTHLRLSRNQIKRVCDWDKNRLVKAINIFREKRGEYFALLEKIYMDNNNFIHREPSRSIIEGNRPSSFANFTQRKYDYDKLEKQLLGWADEEE